MKQVLVLVILGVLLSSCTSQDDDINRAMRLRETLLNSGCSFAADVTADYGDKTYSFTMACTADRDGNMTFTVSAPETIAGITGTLSATGGALTFDDAALAFPLLSDGEVSPVSAPWLLVHTLRGGYLSSAGMDRDLLRLTINDSYEEDALQLDIWLDENNLPQRAEILWQGRRVLSMKVKDFAIV